MASGAWSQDNEREKKRNDKENGSCSYPGQGEGLREMTRTLCLGGLKGKGRGVFNHQSLALRALLLCCHRLSSFASAFASLHFSSFLFRFTHGGASGTAL